MAVVINVMCIFKVVGGDGLTTVQGYNILASAYGRQRVQLHLNTGVNY